MADTSSCIHYDPVTNKSSHLRWLFEKRYNTLTNEDKLTVLRFFVPPCPNCPTDPRPQVKAFPHSVIRTTFTMMIIAITIYMIFTYLLTIVCYTSDY